MRLAGLFVSFSIACCSVAGCKQEGYRGDCAAAAAAVRAKWMLKASTELTGADLDRAGKGLQLGLARRCDADSWSAEATSCFKEIESRGQGCGETLTAEQKGKLASDPATAALVPDRDE